MTYDYYTPEQFEEFTGLGPEGIADIDPPESMTLKAMIILNYNTKQRFSFNVDASGLFAQCTWRNYYRTDAGKYRVDEETGAASLLPIERRDIAIE